MILRVLLLTALVFSPCALGQDRLPRVHILATGGTIASTSNGMLTVDELTAAVPALSEVAEISVEDFVAIGSSRMTPDIQFSLAQRVQEVFEDPDIAGVVITHGTDSLEETAFFVDLLVAGERPVVFTAAQRPPVRVDTDGPRNLYNAVLLASSPVATGMGVMITLNDDIHAARYARKTHATAVEAFQSVGAGKLGYIDGNTSYFQWRPYDRIHLQPARIEPRVDLIRLVAGSDGRLVRASVESGARGLVLEVFGRGNVPPPVTEALREAVARGVTIVFTTRTGAGRVVLYSEFDDLPIISGEDLDGLKARMLLIAALGQTSDRAQIQAYITRLAGASNGR